MLENLTPQSLSSLLSSLPSLPKLEKLALLEELEALQQKKQLKAARDDFLAFCARIYPDWKEGPHHRFLKPLLHEVQKGSKRV